MHPESLFDAAIAAARRSPNRVRHVGAVLVPADGSAVLEAHNSFPDGVSDLEDRHAGDGRLLWMEHAERNAIFAAARKGLRTDGAVLVCTYFPCLECSRAIVQAGIRRLHTLRPDYADPVWGQSFLVSEVILREGGVTVSYAPHDAAVVHAATMVPPAA